MAPGLERLIEQIADESPGNVHHPDACPRSLPEVDPERTAITGASGGGTQAMLLAAIDPRIKLSFPAVMVSTAMQGGCTCENASLLRVDTGNIEFAALFAPRPQGMTTANDWTKEMSTKGFPELQRHYALLGAPKNVMLHRGEHFPHNYNAVSRSAFFTWLNQHFRLGAKEPVLERDFTPLSRDELTVWDAAHPEPKAAGPDFERALLKWFSDQILEFISTHLVMHSLKLLMFLEQMSKRRWQSTWWNVTGVQRCN